MILLGNNFFNRAGRNNYNYQHHGQFQQGPQGGCNGQNCCGRQGTSRGMPPNYPQQPNNPQFGNFGGWGRQQQPNMPMPSQNMPPMMQPPQGAPRGNMQNPHMPPTHMPATNDPNVRFEPVPPELLPPGKQSIGQPDLGAPSGQGPIGGLAAQLSTLTQGESNSIAYYEKLVGVPGISERDKGLVLELVENKKRQIHSVTGLYRDMARADWTAQDMQVETAANFRAGLSYALLQESRLLREASGIHANLTDGPQRRVMDTALHHKIADIAHLMAI